MGSLSSAGRWQAAQSPTRVNPSLARLLSTRPTLGTTTSSGAPMPAGAPLRRSRVVCSTAGTTFAEGVKTQPVTPNPSGLSVPNAIPAPCPLLPDHLRSSDCGTSAFSHGGLCAARKPGNAVPFVSNAKPPRDRVQFACRDLGAHRLHICASLTRIRARHGVLSHGEAEVKPVRVGVKLC